MKKYFRRSILTNTLAITVFFVLLCGFSTSFPQVNTVKLNHYSIHQGLSQSSVTCMVQDSLGYIWIGTQDGLNRFDGYNFTVYRPVPGDSTSLSDNSILCLFVDKSGTLWVGTENGGLNKYNSKTNSFKSYENNHETDEGISSNCIMSISEDKAGNLWIGTYNGLDYFDKAAPKFTQFHFKKNNDGLSSDIVFSTYLDNTGKLWIGTDKGLDTYDQRTNKFGHYYHNSNQNSIISNKIYSIAGDKSGNIWIGTPSGLDRLNLSENKIKHYKYDRHKSGSIGSDYINTIYIDPKGKIWIGTDTDGLNYYNPVDRRFTRFENLSANPADVADKQVVSLLSDKEGNIWIGTFSSGIYTFNNRRCQFDLIKTYYPGVDKFQGNDISSVCEDNDNNLWVGTNNSGLIKFDKKIKKFIHYGHSSSVKSISSNSINTIFKDNRGNIWIGTVLGLDKYDTATNSFVRYKHEPKDINSLGNKYVISIAEESPDVLWIGFSGGGIDEFNVVENTFTHFKHNPADSNSLISNDILNLSFDNSGSLWIGTDGGGLDKLNIRTGKFVHYVHHRGSSGSLSHNVVFQTFQFPDDKSGTLWIATGGGGLDKLNINSGKFKSFTELNGLANNDIYGILGDSKGNLWMSSNKGISKFDVRKEVFHNYDASDNLQSNEFNQGAFFKSKDGKMYFGGLDGLNSFYPDSIESNPFNPAIVFTSVKDLNNPENKIIMFSTAETLNLAYTDNIISFKFASLSYIDPARNKFAYFLEGVNKSWIDNGTNNSVTFSNLSPGSYVLRVKGTNNDGIWSKKTAFVNIDIEPPYWQTWWFKIMIALGIISLVIFIVKLRLMSVRLQNKKLESLVGERTTELIIKTEELTSVNKKQNELLKLLTESEKKLKDLNLNKDKIMSILAHDLRSPFNGLLGFAELLSNEIQLLSHEEIKNAATSIRITAGNLLKLLNNLLDWSLVQSNMIKFDPNVENLNSSVESTIHLFNINAEQKSIKLKNEVDKHAEVWADKNMLDIIFRNLISNGIKFTPKKGEISISSRNVNGFVEVKISDTGVGIDMDKQNKLFDLNAPVSSMGTENEPGTGLGLNLCKEIIIKHGGDMRIDSMPGRGTDIIFTLLKS